MESERGNQELGNNFFLRGRDLNGFKRGCEKEWKERQERGKGESKGGK